MIVTIRLKKYLRDFLVSVVDEDGLPVYGQEPVKFSSKSRVGQMLRTWLRRPPVNGVLPTEGLSGDGKHTLLKVEVDESTHLKGDKMKTYLSEQAQDYIATEIYNLFCSFAFTYIEDHLNTQRQLKPRRKPQMKFACIDLQDEMNLYDIEWNTIRRAYEREKKQQKGEIRKKMEKTI